MLKIKKNIVKKLNKVETREASLYIGIFLLGLISPFASYDVIALSSLSFIFLLCFSKMEIVLVFSIASFLSFGIMSFFNGHYLAYFMGVGIYAVSYAWFSNKKISTIFAGVVFILLRLILLNKTLNFSYQILFLIECFMILILPYNVKSGFLNIKNAKNILSIEDYINNFITLAVFAASFSSIFSRYIYFDVAILLAIALCFASYQKFDLSFISLLSSSMLLTVRGDYLYFLAIIAVFFIANLSAKRKSWLIYILASLVSVVINIVLIGFFGDLTLVFITETALLIYFFINKYIKIEVLEIDMVREKSQKDYYKLTSNLSKLQKSLSFLGHTIVDITKLNEKSFKEIPLEDMVVNEICRKCKNNLYCWAQKYSQTQDEFMKYSNSLTLKNEAKFSEWFINLCDKNKELKKSFEENQRLLLTKRYIRQSQRSNQKLLQTAFLAISHTISDIEVQSRKGYDYNANITFEMDKYISLLDIKSKFCLANKNPDSFTLTSLGEIEQKDLYKIKAKLELLFNRKFENPIIEKQGVEFVYSFVALRVFDFEIYHDSKAFDNICGDECLSFEDSQKMYLLLSDGMGTGVFAAKESKTVVAMAKSLLRAQIDVFKVIEIINLALNLKSNGETGASIDILAVDKYTGKAVLTKAGASESVVLHSKGMDRLYKDSLPLGILKDTKPAQYEIDLKENDTIVLMSDGARIENSLRSMYDFSCEKIVSNVMKTSSKDDKTVAALKLIRVN